MQKIRGIIDSNKGSKQESLIRLLNPVITGWVNYYKNCVVHLIHSEKLTT